MFSKSIDAFNDAKMVIPGGVNSPVRAFGGVLGTPPFMKCGSGAFIEDIDGNKYIDFVQSWGPLIFGHCDKDIEEAIIDRLKLGISFGAPTEIETTLAKEIVGIYEGIDKIRFVSSGTEAVMSAIRIARGYSGKEDIIKFEGCYHGHSDSLLVKAGSGSTTFGTPSSLGVPRDIAKHTLLAKFNDIFSVKEHIKHDHNISCIIIEPIAGNMGFIPSDKNFLLELREICTRENIVLIFDEVMSGFRVALGGASEFYGITPDMATFGKVIGGGMPVGAFGGKGEIMKYLSPEGGVYQAGTLSGNPLAMASGLAMIRKLKKDPNIFKTLQSRGERLTYGLKDIAKSFDIELDVGSIGSMFGFFFNNQKVTNYDLALKSNREMFAKFHQGMLQNGVYFACSQFEAGFISTPITDDLIDRVLEVAKGVFREISFS